MMTQEEILRVQRAVRRALYGCLCSMLAALLIGIGNIAYTNHVDEKRYAVARQTERDRREAEEQNRLIVCQVARGQAEALEGAESDAGRKARAAWIALAVRFNCE